MKVKMLQREKTYEEGTCAEEDVATGEGGMKANEAVVIEEALEDLHNRNQKGLLSHEEVDSRGNEQRGSRNYYWWPHWWSVVKTQRRNGAQ